MAAMEEEQVIVSIQNLDLEEDVETEADLEPVTDSKEPSEPAALSLEVVEEITGYRFRNKELLTESFTDGSHKSDGGLSYERLEYLGDSIEEFMEGIKEYPSHSNGMIDPPKVLADLIESLTGAIFIDTDSYMDATWQQQRAASQARLPFSPVGLATAGKWPCLSFFLSDRQQERGCGGVGFFHHRAATAGVWFSGLIDQQEGRKAKGILVIWFSGVFFVTCHKQK